MKKELEPSEGNIGNLTSGYNDTYENYLVPTKEGTCTGAVLLKYEDSQGNEKSERKEFTVEVQSMARGTEEPIMVEFPTEKPWMSSRCC